MLEEEPDAGLGNGGLGRLAACFLNSMATMQLPAMGYGLRYEYGIFKQTIEDGWQREQPDNWLRHPDPWEVPRPQEMVEIKLGCFVRGAGRRPAACPAGRPACSACRSIARLSAMAARRSTRCACGPRPRPTTSTSRRSAPAISSARWPRQLAAESVTRVLYPDNSTSMGQGLRFVQEYFLVACSLADLVRRFRRANADWSALPDKVAIQLNDTHPSLAVPELMRILLDEAGLGWDEAWDLTRRTLAYTNHTLLPEALEKWPLRWFEPLLPRQLEIVYEINRRLARSGAEPFPGRRGPGRADQPDRGRRRAQDPHGQSGDRRLAQHQRRRRDPFGVCCAR